MALRSQINDEIVTTIFKYKALHDDSVKVKGRDYWFSVPAAHDGADLIVTKEVLKEMIDSVVYRLRGGFPSMSEWCLVSLMRANEHHHTTYDGLSMSVREYFSAMYSDITSRILSMVCIDLGVSYE